MRGNLKEIGEFLAYLLLLVILGAWLSGDFFTRTGHALGTLASSFPFIDVVSYALPGVFIGALGALLLFDYMKGLQSFLVLVTSLVVVSSNWADISPGLKFFVAGAIAGLLIGILDARREEFPDGILNSLRKSKLNVKKLTLTLTVVGLLSAIMIFSSLGSYVYFVYTRQGILPVQFIGDSIFSVVFLATFLKFMMYERKGSRITLLGPRKSGKTFFLTGVYGYVRLRKPLGNTSAEIEHLHGTICRPVKEIDGEIFGEHLESTKEIQQMQINYFTGKIFPKEVFMESPDIPGEQFEELIEEVKKGINAKKSREEIVEGLDGFVKGIYDEALASDKVMFVVDGEELRRNTEDIRNLLFNYNHLAKFVGMRGRRYYILLTKADLLTDPPIIEYIELWEKAGELLTDAGFDPHGAFRYIKGKYPAYIYCRKFEGEDSYRPRLSKYDFSGDRVYELNKLGYDEVIQEVLEK